jgi:hypothetical protein
VNCYPFIEAEKAQQRNVKRACELVKVSRAAYYTESAPGLAAGSGVPRLDVSGSWKLAGTPSLSGYMM